MAGVARLRQAKGDGWKLTESGATAMDGRLPVNCSGGVLSSNPIGASGMLRFGEAALQVRGAAGEHQVDGARKALGHAYGGGSQFFAMWVELFLLAPLATQHRPSSPTGVDPVDGNRGPDRARIPLRGFCGGVEVLHASPSEGKLVGQRCPTCEKVYIPPRSACPVDGTPTAEEVELPDTGNVTTFCIVNVPFLGQRMMPPVRRRRTSCSTALTSRSCT